MEKQRSPLVLIPPFFVAGTSEASESIDPVDSLRANIPETGLVLLISEE